MRCTHDDYADCPACEYAIDQIQNPPTDAHDEAVWEDREYGRRYER